MPRATDWARYAPCTRPGCGRPTGQPMPDAARGTTPARLPLGPGQPLCPACRAGETADHAARRQPDRHHDLVGATR